MILCTIRFQDEFECLGLGCGVVYGGGDIRSMVKAAAEVGARGFA